VSATGTQISTVNIGASNKYIGGTFIFTNATSSTATVTSIMLTESGTVDAKNNLENISLYYDIDSTDPYDCGSESYGSGDLQFGATSTSFSSANGTSTYSGTVGLAASTSMCVYVVLSVGSGAAKDETIEIEIDNPSVDVIIATGTVSPSTSVELPGTTSIYFPDASVTANAQRKSDNFTTIANQGWTDENQVNLSALASNVGNATTSKFDYYFELLDESGIYTAATSVPANPCTSGTAYGSCSTKIWNVSASTTTWYNTDWGYRKKLTINANQVTTTTSNFIILATTTDSGLAYTSHGGHMASSTGGDILVIDSDGSTILDYDREYYSSSTGELALWIETSISSTTNKTIYLYYGNSTLSADQEDETGTWGSTYALVLHMKEDPSSSILYDSTSNNNNATDYGNPTQTTGQVGYAVDFDGSGDYARVSDSASIDDCTGQTQPRTWSFWMNLNAVGSNKLITDKSNFSGRHLWSELQSSPNQFRGGVAAAGQLVSDTAPAAGNWYYLTYAFDGSEARLYIDGTLDQGPNAQSPNPDNNDALRIMGRGDDAFCTNGIMDELRVSNVARTPGWIKTGYNNQKNVASFLDIQAEESILGATYEGVVNIISIPDRGSSTDSSLGYKWQVLACNDESECSFWDDFNSSLPNFKVDVDIPTAPGNLEVATTTPTTIKLNFDSQTTEPNFAEYKIFYKSGVAGVTVNDTKHVDPNLDYIDYNSAASTTIMGLEANTQYVINIWAYDLAGNKTAAAEVVVSTKSAPHSRARSVQFLAGDYSSDNGITGQNSDTNQAFSTFNFRLAETEVIVRNAYILFEAQFEAYHANSSDYTGYELAFDICQESCTADAWGGSDKITIDDNSVLAYDEADGNQVRILWDVTEETQLKIYSGSDTNMEAQFGYKLETGSATTSISYAKAVLVVTYSYNDDDSTNFTNTVIYPLESTDSGDSGTRQASSTDDCTRNTDCPEFDYNMEIPEVATKLSQWFQTYAVNDGHGSSDVEIDVNIQGTEVDSDTYFHEAANGGEQSNFPRMIFDDVSGFSENTSQTLEYHAVSLGAATYYLMGGEVVETYTALKSASTKTRTVSFPIGIITNGQSITAASGTALVYFPENGAGSGIVDIKKAWFRIISNDYNGAAHTVTVLTEVGDNSQSGNSIYNVNVGDTVIKPAFNIIHVIPSGDYSELESANASSSKAVTLYTTNSSTDIGGVSAELMITYTYTDESSGYLTSLNLFGGQSNDNGNLASTTRPTANAVFSELRGTKTERAAGLLGSYLFSDSDGDMPSVWFTMDTNIATNSPVCANAFYHHPDAMNSFTEFYKDVTASILTTDNQSYTACYSNTNGSDSSAGAKMNAILLYTYQWDAPPAELSQNDWRWYENIDGIEPTTPKANENTAISSVNLGDQLRLRMNIIVTKEALATSTQAYKLQYGTSSDCTTLSDWTDVGGISGSEAWTGYNNPDPADGTTLDSTLLASSTKPETYEETNPSASNPRGIPVNGQGEWDWVLYNNAASSSANYCFRLIKSDGTELDDYLADSYPQLTTAASNTAPNNPTSLGQYRDDEMTIIPNMSWINENNVKLTAAATDPNISEIITLYFELATNTSAFTTATSGPTGACTYGTAYNDCASNIWYVATSSPDDFRTDPYIGTTSITAIPESSVGYKWQVLACDDGGACSGWVQPGSGPNFKIDTTSPDAPGDLLFATSTITSITLTFGASSTEDNFEEYKMYYKAGIFGVNEGDTPHTDPNLSSQWYDGATSTIIENLSANTEYVFNIWAYDKAGNIATATNEVVGTTTSAYNPPSGTILSAVQKSDGSGVIDITIKAEDPDSDDTLRAKIMASTTCDFSSGVLDPTLDETNENVSATKGDPVADNDSYYQVGTTSGWIITSGTPEPGKNFVLFDWLSKIDLPNADGTYCLGLVVNDGLFDQTATHTKTVTIDNVNPATPAALTLNSKAYNSVVLNLNTPYSSDTNFGEYKIFYKEGTAGVTENDNEFNKNNDSNLDYYNYSGAATTTITGLNPNTQYVFNIWAYDTFGNKASSTQQLQAKTNAAPTNISADQQYRDDATTTIANNSWINENSVILKASAHDQDAGDLITFYYELITATGTYTTATTVPPTACASGTPYLSCSDNVWQATTTDSQLPTDWYSEDWLYRKRITINASQVATTAPDFPVLATTTDSDLASHARSDGYDILFTDSTGTTTILYEREYYNSSTGNLVAWIKTNISSTTDTEIYMYYGNSGAITDNATTTGVWDNNFKGVWHLQENVVDESTQAGVHNDSTVNNNDGDQYGNNEIATGMYQGQDFDGINDYISVDDDNTLDIIDAVTMEFWMKGVVANPPTATSVVYTTAGNDTFIVPPGVTSITVKTWGGGAGGGAGSFPNGEQGSNPGGDGGGAGFSQVTLSVTPGETLDFHVGGGGSGGTYSGDNAGDGGGGGGRSEVSHSSSVLVVAAGGGSGGGGSDRVYASGGDGGSGGGEIGTTGGAAGSATGGSGGTQSAGGAAGTGQNDGQAGASQAGGDGADGRCAQGADGSGAAGGTTNGGDGGDGDIGNRCAAAGGGGSGYYGGGGGGQTGGDYNAGGGGGGGSSFATSTATATSTEAGSGRNAGNNDDSDYAGNAGQGGVGGAAASSGTAGNNGRIVITYTPGISVVGKGSDAYQVNLNDDLYLSGQVSTSSVATQIAEGWHHVALTYDRNMGGSEELKLFVDGVKVAVADYDNVINTNADNLKMGEILDGIIDEVRISNTARSPTWIKTSYSNQKSVNNFLSFTSESTVTSFYETVLVVTIPDNPDYSTGYKWQVMACDDDSDCTGWDQFNASTPNFKVDTTDPSPSGQLTEDSKTSNTITLGFGSETDEDNFAEYKIFYSTSSSVTESDTEHDDPDLDYKNYNSTNNTTVTGLDPATTYYFNIWVYDIVGHKASSTIKSIQTDDAVASPGVLFYTKNDRQIYYQVWDGTGWGIEQSSGNITTAGDNIRHLRAVRSDDGGKVGILFKTWDGANQQWLGAVYRYAANDFVSTSTLGSAQGDGTNNHLLTGCIASLSGGEFFVIRNDNTSDGAIAFSWNVTDGWTSEGTVPGTTGVGKMVVMNGCYLARRPGTDNYLLMTFDEDSDVGSIYYKGSSVYSNSGWTTWQEHADEEEDADNYVGEAYFDPSDNTQGALYYSDSTSNNYAYAKYFSCTGSSINYGAAQASPNSSPDDWGNDFVHGEFAPDPTSVGLAYFVGRDIGGELNVYLLDASSSIIAWATTTGGDNISTGNLYSETNDSQKPFATYFYEGGKGLVVGNYNTSHIPFYSVITTAANSVAATSAVENATADLWTRVRLYDDPNEDELLAIFQNDDIDYVSAFWDGGNDQFYSAGNQSWNERVAVSGAADRDDECTTFAYTKYNSAPDAPTGLEQYKTDASTTIPNGNWTNESTVKFKVSATDDDTSEVITLYLQLRVNNDDFTTSTDKATFNACASTTVWNSCNSKIWAVASSSEGDYSVSPFTATATITSIATSTTGYKWQVIACDDSGDCSSWAEFNATQPNFYVDTEPPSPPGNLTIMAKTSQAVTLTFGSQTDEPLISFSKYRIFYSTNTPITEADAEHIDTDLNHRNYNNTADTIVVSLSSSTLYYFNIWVYDKAGNVASATPEVSTTTSALPFINQSSFRLENDDGADVNSNSFEVAASTTLTNLNIGERLAVRIQIENTGGDLKSNTVYKLQYQNYTDGGSWTDVGNSTDMSYALGLAGTNGNFITSEKAEANPTLDWRNGTWHENVNQTGNFDLYDGEFTEFVFMVETSNATTSKTYRFRLYNVTDDQPLDNYEKYPAITTVATDTKRYSKGTYATLLSNTNDLTYYLDPEGYADVATDDDSNRDQLTSSNYPVFNFVSLNSTNTDAISVTWNGSSTVAASVRAVYLQVYKFGTGWESRATNTAAAANAEFTLSASLNSSMSSYYSGALYWSYWRVYQESGSQTLSTDYFNFATSTPVPETKQFHYRWRDDDGDETSATWLEAEDTGSPTAGSEIGKGSTTRLRLAVANIGGGDASSYTYRLEYASSSVGCATDPGDWVAVPVTAVASEHFEMVDSTYFGDASTTTSQLSIDGYAFVTGDMVEDPSNTSAALTLSEDEYTEIEYVFQVTNDAEDAMTYCFRVTNAGAVLDNYDIYPVVTLSGSTNEAPAFSVWPSDNDSASTSPTNFGGNVTFTATGGDSEGDDYYLAICQTNSITPGNDEGPPTCNSGSWCISSSTASSTPTQCTYTAATSSEVLAWYAFVCDKKAGFGIAKCSNSSQGSGSPTNDSPFVVNHPPAFTAVATTDDNKDPGGTFIITASSTDDDSAGGDDLLTMYVCDTNDAAWGGCGGNELCSISTSTSNPSCSFATTTPAIAGAYTYYAFIFDQHALAADPNMQSNTYTVNNVAPTLGTLTLNNGSNITLGLKDAGDKAVSTINTSVQDLNGCNDLDSAVATIYMSNVTNGYNCSEDYNYCYKATTTNCVKSECASSSDMIATYTCTVYMKYFAVPTDDDFANNPWKDYVWMSYIQVYDGVYYTDATSTGVELDTILALEVGENTINFGSNFYPGDDTGTDNSTTTIVNFGNSPIDTNITGTDMDGSPIGAIDSTYIEYSLTENFNYTAGTDLLNTGAPDVDTITPKATSTTYDIEDKVYWGIGIPWDADSAIYTGLNTFQVIIDNDGW
jgi:hypothetical protein